MNVFFFRRFPGLFLCFGFPRSELLKLAVRVMIIQVRAGGGEDGCMLEDVFCFWPQKGGGLLATWNLGFV